MTQKRRRKLFKNKTQNVLEIKDAENTYKKIKTAIIILEIS